MNERGSALVETLLLGLVLLIPLIWVLGTLAEVHRAALATTTAAREAGFDAARAATPLDAQRRIDAAVASALADHGVDPDGAWVEWTPAGLERGSAVEVRVVYDVPVLHLPLLGSVPGPSIPVSASHLARVDPYRSRP